MDHTPDDFEDLRARRRRIGAPRRWCEFTREGMPVPKLGVSPAEPNFDRLFERISGPGVPTTS
jgi:hypothetical protein